MAKFTEIEHAVTGCMEIAALDAKSRLVEAELHTAKMHVNHLTRLKAEIDNELKSARRHIRGMSKESYRTLVEVLLDNTEYETLLDKTEV
jgi:F0F1-type ATP synthase membrane subunit b/b'